MATVSVNIKTRTQLTTWQLSLQLRRSSQCYKLKELESDCNKPSE